MLKDVSIRLRGEYREDLSAIERDWPVPQVDIIGAALKKLRELPPKEQAEAFRSVKSPRQRAKQTA